MESNKVKVWTSVVLKEILYSQLESLMVTVTLAKQGNLSQLPFLHHEGEKQPPIQETTNGQDMRESF